MRSSASTHTSATAKGMTVLQTAGLGVLAIPPTKLDKSKVETFRAKLHDHGIDTSRWGVHGAKSVEHLFWETYQQRGCVICGLNKSGNSSLKRVTRLVKIRLIAEIFGVEHTLFSRMQFMHDGQHIERKQVPLKKLMWNINEGDEPDLDESIYAEGSPYTEDWRIGCKKALQERLGLSERWQEQHLEEDVHAYSYHTEDNRKSDGYPGLNTLYCIHEATFRVVDSEHPRVQCIGLPHGQEFATTEGEFNFGQHDENGLPIGTQLNIWMWARDSKLPQPKAQRTPATPSSPTSPVSPAAGGPSDSELRLIKRVPLPTVSAQALTNMLQRLNAKGLEPPSPELRAAMEGEKTDWGIARRMAQRISDPTYSLNDFNKDLAAFPELNLYLLENTEAAGNSGRTIGDEYQRTVGAFFAVYWLMRLDIDGKEGFSFGVDSNWKVINPNQTKDEKQLYPADKRRAFHAEGKWDYFQRLLVNSGLLESQGRRGGYKVNEKRFISLLALTAIHDVMKMDSLLPKVQQAHAPYNGYSGGDTIGNHDHALSYVMDFYPELLPSFKDLDPGERRSVQFTQCNLCFNHGWFVQAEAPPGAVFTKFREALIRDHKSQIGSRDVALYFVHWLTDLAGAEPTPLGGCEKFVTKFPLPVLNSFLRSFEFVEKIAEQTETEVMEQYLKIRWEEHTPSVGPAPVGDDAVAKMRILCMAQANANQVLKSFRDLSEEDREVLCVEMARTGCLGQSYSANLVPAEVRNSPTGPAFLIYYGPAFLQNLGSDLPARRLSVLAEVYRCARELWPATVSKVATTVTVRIDTIKALSITDMKEATQKGDLWLMTKHNESEAFIERSSKRKLNKFITTGQSFQILDLSCLQVYN